MTLQSTHLRSYPHKLTALFQQVSSIQITQAPWLPARCQQLLVSSIHPFGNSPDLPLIFNSDSIATTWVPEPQSPDKCLTSTILLFLSSLEKQQLLETYSKFQCKLLKVANKLKDCKQELQPQIKLRKLMSQPCIINQPSS